MRNKYMYIIFVIFIEYKTFFFFIEFYESKWQENPSTYENTLIFFLIGECFEINRKFVILDKNYKNQYI